MGVERLEKGTFPLLRGPRKGAGCPRLGRHGSSLGSGGKGRVSLAADEAGQATAEYAILAFVTVTVVVIAFEAVWDGILNYYQDLASLISLPIP